MEIAKQPTENFSPRALDEQVKEIDLEGYAESSKCSSLSFVKIQDKSFCSTNDPITNRNYVNTTPESAIRFIGEPNVSFQDIEIIPGNGDEEEPESVFETVIHNSSVSSDSVPSQPREESENNNMDQLLDQMIYEGNQQVVDWQNRVGNEVKNKIRNELIFALIELIFSVVILIDYYDEKKSAKGVAPISTIFLAYVFYLVKNCVNFLGSKKEDRYSRKTIFAALEYIGMILFWGTLIPRMVIFHSFLTISILPAILIHFLSLHYTDVWKRDKFIFIRKSCVLLSGLMVGINLDNYAQFSFRIVLMPIFFACFLYGVFGLIVLLMLVQRLLSRDPDQRLQKFEKIGYIWHVLVGFYGPLWFWMVYKISLVIDKQTYFEAVTSAYGCGVHCIIFLTYSISYKKYLTEWFTKTLAQSSPENLENHEIPAPNEIPMVSEYELVLQEGVAETSTHQFVLVSSTYCIRVEIGKKGLPKDEREKLKKRLQKANKKKKKEDYRRNQSVAPKDKDHSIISVDHMHEQQNPIPMEKTFTRSFSENLRIEKQKQLRKVTTFGSGHFTDRECYVCCERIANVVYEPCGHAAECLNCLKVRIKQSNKCAFCRKETKRVNVIDENLIKDNLVKVIQVYTIDKRVRPA